MEVAFYFGANTFYSIGKNPCQQGCNTKYALDASFPLVLSTLENSKGLLMRSRQNIWKKVNILMLDLGDALVAG